MGSVMCIRDRSNTLRAIGGRSKGLGGSVELGFHGTSRGAARGIRGTGFRPGSRQNIYGTTKTFIEPSPRQFGKKKLHDRYQIIRPIGFFNFLFPLNFDSQRDFFFGSHSLSTQTFCFFESDGYCLGNPWFIHCDSIQCIADFHRFFIVCDDNKLRISG